MKGNPEEDKQLTYFFFKTCVYDKCEGTVQVNNERTVRFIEKINLLLKKKGPLHLCGLVSKSVLDAWFHLQNYSPCKCHMCRKGIGNDCLQLSFTESQNRKCEVNDERVKVKIKGLLEKDHSLHSVRC